VVVIGGWHLYTVYAEVKGSALELMDPVLHGIADGRPLVTVPLKEQFQAAEDGSVLVEPTVRHRVSPL